MVARSPARCLHKHVGTPGRLSESLSVKVKVLEGRAYFVRSVVQRSVISGWEQTAVGWLVGKR